MVKWYFGLKALNFTGASSCHLKSSNRSISGNPGASHHFLSAPAFLDSAILLRNWRTVMNMKNTNMTKLIWFCLTYCSHAVCLTRKKSTIGLSWDTDEPEGSSMMYFLWETALQLILRLCELSSCKDLEVLGHKPTGAHSLDVFNRDRCSPNVLLARTFIRLG